MTAQAARSEFRTACKGILKDPSGYPSAVYQGKTIYFCTRACLLAFEKNPVDFMEEKIEHPKEEE